MKSHIYWITLLALLLPITVSSQTEKELAPGYYVVVGAYGKSKESYAKIYRNQLVEEGHQASYGFDSKRNFFYVYLDYYTDFKQSLDKMLAVRDAGSFTDAWVRIIPGDIPITSEPVISEKAEEEQPPTPEELEEPEDLLKERDLEEKENEKDEIKEEKAIILYPPTPEEIEGPSEPEIVEETKVVNMANTEVYLNLFNSTTNRIVDGEVLVVDTERSKLLGEFPGNEVLSLPDPNTASGKLTLIADAFGYRKMQHEVNFNTPLADTSEYYFEYVDNTILVNFNLIKYRKGDITILYHVYFYNDAALMLPESKYELNNLASMMEENPDYKIRLHGHTNGKNLGKILDVGPNKEFFQITSDAVESNGSAKNLSRKRAETIKNYLVEQGIEEDRMDIKAWGGRKPLFDKLGPDARQNVRVEVEILSD